MIAVLIYNGKVKRLKGKRKANDKNLSLGQTYFEVLCK
jgi:hypothetical protein